MYAREEIHFDKWISDAVNFGETESEKALYEYNATDIFDTKTVVRELLEKYGC